MCLEITVRFTGQLRTLAGHSSLNLSVRKGATLGEAVLALRDLVSPSFAEQVVEPLTEGKRSVALLLLNRTLYSEAEWDRPMFEGDVVAFVMPMDGG
jgi:molybdopterin converting factor small subunit